MSNRRKLPTPARPVVPTRKGKPILKVAAAIIIVAITVTVVLLYMNPTVKSISNTFYDKPIVSGKKVAIPYDFVKDRRLVFVDVKFSQKQGSVTYQGRTFWFELYRKGEYLPLILWVAPSGLIKGAVRVCEPCSSFSMRIEERLLSQELVCVVCFSRWNLEDLRGIKGQCAGDSVYAPPPLMPISTVGQEIQIDVSALGLSIVG